jgi:hypothetical protein
MMPKNSICTEIGVFNGDFSKEIIRMVNPEMLYLIDLWNHDDKIHPNNFEQKLDNSKFSKMYKNVQKHFANKTNVKILKGRSIDLLNSFEDESLDWIYVDGDHQYLGVKSDLKLSF